MIFYEVDLVTQKKNIKYARKRNMTKYVYSIKALKSEWKIRMETVFV